jgi:putative transposase
LFRYQLDPGLVDEIRKATNGGVVLGSHRFADEVAILLGVRTKLGVSGRPMNKTKED